MSQNIRHSVLIIDNDVAAQRVLLEIFAQKGISAVVATSERAAMEKLENARFGLVFMNVYPQSARPSFELLSHLKATNPELPVIVLADTAALSAVEIIDLTVSCIQAGCEDIISKPIPKVRVNQLINVYLPAQEMPSFDAQQPDFDCNYKIVGKSPRLTQTISLALRAAPTSAPVLIAGQSGTGKELISYLIHKNSHRAANPYIRVNCAALNDSLLESELFGHEKGAFTGAYLQRKGRFEQAHAGTLLLDEITETGPRFQAQLLRILEQQDFQRVGGSQDIKVNVRIVSTTNRDLAAEVANGRFRADLYYRLSAIRLYVPSLKERIDDLPHLVWHFVNLYAPEARRAIKSLDPTMLDIFANYNWPGNIRQLRNVIRTALILGSGPVLSLADVSWLMDELVPVIQATDVMDQIQSNMTLDELEQKAILNTLEQTSGNQTRAAKILGISDRTLREKMRRYRQTLATVDA